MGFVDRITGKTAAKAAKKAGEIQSDTALAAAETYNPLLSATNQGLSKAGFLTDPNAQFDYLQSNPLFQAVMQQNQFQTQQAQDQLFSGAAAQGRLTSGDTIQQVQNLGQNSANNLLLAASPLIQDQKASIGGLLDFQNSILANQGNLRTGAAAAQAGGIVGAENARGAGYGNIMDLGGSLLGSNIGQGLLKKIPGFGG